MVYAYLILTALVAIAAGKIYLLQRNLRAIASQTLKAKNQAEQTAAETQINSLKGEIADADKARQAEFDKFLTHHYDVDPSGK